MAGAIGLGLTSSVPGDITPGTEKQRGFVNDNVLHSSKYGDIHYSGYIPESYVIPEASHFDMYDLAPFVSEAFEFILPFFGKNL